MHLFKKGQVELMGSMGASSEAEKYKGRKGWGEIKQDDN